MMKLFGIQTVDGGLALGLPSGQHVLLAIPDDRARAAQLVGERILTFLDDPDQPHAQSQDAMRRTVRRAPDENNMEPDKEDGLAVLETGLEASRLVMRTLQLLSRGRER